MTDRRLSNKLYDKRDDFDNMSGACPQHKKITLPRYVFSGDRVIILNISPRFPNDAKSRSIMICDAYKSHI